MKKAFSRKLLSLLLVVMMLIPTVVSALLFVSAEGELPDDAITIGHVGYPHGNATAAIIMAGDGKTLGELVDATHGQTKDPVWWTFVVVDKDNKVTTIGANGAAGKRESIVCPEGGYILGAWSSNADAFKAVGAIDIGDTITLYNVDLDEVRACEKYYALENAGFTVKSGKGENVALGCSYVANPGLNQYTAKLTDGEANGAIAYDSSWYAFHANNTKDGVGTVVIDLGVICKVNCVSINTFLGNASGIVPPKSMTVKYSVDGVNYKDYASKSYEIPGASDTVAWETLGKEADAILTRFVKLEVALQGTFAFINEIAVYGEKTDAEVPAEGAYKIDRLGYEHVAGLVQLIAGDGKTVGDLCGGKDMNANTLYVVDANDIIVAIYDKWGRPDGVKTDVKCPTGGYMIGVHQDRAIADVKINAKVGDYVTLYNVDLDAVRAAGGYSVPELAYFAVTSVPEDAVKIDRLGYEHTAGLIQLIAGDGKTVGDLCGGKDMNANTLYVVDANDIIVAIYDKWGRPDGVKTDVKCPTGGYMIGVHQDRATTDAKLDVIVGDQVTLYDVDLDAVRAGTGYVIPKHAYFTVKGSRWQNVIGSFTMDKGLWQNVGDDEPKPAINASYTVSMDADYIYLNVKVDRPWEYKNDTYQTGATNFRIWMLGDGDFATESNRKFFDVTLKEDGTFACYLAKAETDKISATADTKAETIDVSFKIDKAAVNADKALKLMVSYSSPYIAEEGKETKYNCWHITPSSTMPDGWSGNASMYATYSTVAEVKDVGNDVYTTVDGSSVGAWQAGKAEKGLSYSYAWEMTDDEFLLHTIINTTALTGTAASYGNGAGTNLRVWLSNRAEGTTTYTNFFDISYRDGEVVGRICYNSNPTDNKAVWIAGYDTVQPYSYKYLIKDNTLEIVVVLPRNLIGATDKLEAIITVSNKADGANNCALYSSSYLTPYSGWENASIVYPTPVINTGDAYDGIMSEVATGCEVIHNDAPVGNYTGKLTDGVLGGTAFDNKWYGWTFNVTPKPAYTSVVLDLGKVTDDIAKIGAHIWPCGGSGIGVPTKVEILVSVDGAHYAKAGEMTDFAKGGPAWYYFSPEKLIKARYIKYVVYPPTDGVFVFFSELSVKTLNKNAIPLDHVGYNHANYSEIVAGGSQTIGDITARGQGTNGSAKDANYFYAIAVDRAGYVAEVNFKLGRTDGVKTDMVCPAGGYILLVNAAHVDWNDAQKAGFGASVQSIEVGAKIELYGVSKEDLAFARTGNGTIVITDAYFTFDNDNKYIVEEKVDLSVSHVNLYNYNCFYQMVITGEGKNSTNLLNQTCVDMIAIKVDLVDGKNVVTAIEGAGVAKTMTASANGFILYVAPNRADEFEAAKAIQVGWYVVDKSYPDRAASETPVGYVKFVNALPEQIEAQPDPSKPAIGDADGDGAFGAADTTKMMQYLVDLTTLPEDVKEASLDLDASGTVDVFDVVLMLRYMSGMIKEFPAE